MREPLAWFILIGAIIFAADRFQDDDPVIVDDAVRHQISSLWQTQMGVSPDDQELKSLVNHWIREEIFYREAVRLGLDRDDTIIRRRLVQKLEFLAQEVNENDISQDDIKRHYEAHQADYTLPVRYSISQIYFDDIEAAIRSLPEITDSTEWQVLGKSSLLPRTLIKKSVREIGATFGTEFAEQVTQLATARWTGPMTSTFGFHLVRLDAIAESEVTPLTHIDRQVMNDLIHKRRDHSLEDYYRDLLDQHEVKYQ